MTLLLPERPMFGNNIGRCWMNIGCMLHTTSSYILQYLGWKHLSIETSKHSSVGVNFQKLEKWSCNSTKSHLQHHGITPGSPLSHHPHVPPTRSSHGLQSRAPTDVSRIHWPGASMGVDAWSRECSGTEEKEARAKGRRSGGGGRCGRKGGDEGEGGVVQGEVEA